VAPAEKLGPSFVMYEHTALSFLSDTTGSRTWRVGAPVAADARVGGIRRGFSRWYFGRESHAGRRAQCSGANSGGTATPALLFFPLRGAESKPGTSPRRLREFPFSIGIGFRVFEIAAESVKREGKIESWRDSPFHNPLECERGTLRDGLFNGRISGRNFFRRRHRTPERWVQRLVEERL